MEGVYIGFDNWNIKAIWPVEAAEVQASRERKLVSFLFNRSIK